MVDTVRRLQMESETKVGECVFAETFNAELSLLVQINAACCGYPISNYR